MENNLEKDYLDNPSKYFTPEEWRNLKDYEKVRIENLYEMYVCMISEGLKISKPEFMMRNKEQPTVSPEIKEETNLKRKTRPKTEQRTESTKTSKPRYPKRNMPMKDYAEEDIIPDDRYIYCDKCMNEYVDNCNIHDLMFISDNPVPLIPENPNRARETVPKDWLNVSSSKIANGGEGVWTLIGIPMGIRFGPYEGTCESDENDSQYRWQIKKDGRIVSYIDGQDTSKANWMRYVNCARNKIEQNLMAYQYRGQIYYRTVVDIRPGVELLVFYGPQFARALGIDTTKYNSPPEKPLEDNIFECQTCRLTFSSPIYLEKHVGRCINKKISKTEKKVAKKIQEHSSNESFKCHLCDMIYSVKSLYKRHLMVKHCVYDENPVKINQDNVNNTDSDSLSVDSGYHDAPKNLGISGSYSRRFKCSQCHRLFTNRTNLKNHTRVHSGERPYKCLICEKTFTQSGSLNKHKLIHTGEKPHECDICHKTFNQKENLTRHKRIHDNLRPYQCSVCSKAFTNVNHLRRHKRIHSGDKPYHCHICQYKSSDASNLKSHIRTHTGEKPYTCEPVISHLHN